MTTETSKSAGDVPAKSATNNRSFKIKGASIFCSDKCRNLIKRYSKNCVAQRYFVTF